jgi:hypothetical protein
MPTRRFKRLALAQLLRLGCAVVLGGSVPTEQNRAPTELHARHTFDTERRSGK